MTSQYRFWEHKSLAEMNRAEWESLCDGCAKCCLQKLEDDDSGDIYYTRVVCRYLDDRCQCRVYPQRQEKVASCMTLTTDPEQLSWMPESCAYRRVHEGKPLPAWHPLLTGKALSTLKKGKSVRQWPIIPDDCIPEDEWEDHIIFKVS